MISEYPNVNGKKNSETLEYGKAVTENIQCKCFISTKVETRGKNFTPHMSRNNLAQKEIRDKVKATTEK